MERMEEKIKQLEFKHVAMTAKISTYTQSHIVGQNIRDERRAKGTWFVLSGQIECIKHPCMKREESTQT